ncbi:hypothetical protein PRIPAC_87953 [Pristionchus pacificus]|uniref:Uncharacterized protein n=1 Tax=Pristionchus pacificus TaxID=54126 RepID=A0A2A6B848_PRIPA|nr:hypothetical protein PRIPAC_87953 [Pristionchus pacificus]|eukprot:PDM62041.1 hypothetical protein PRIPAC_51483 [Pristionchus pacificus]
MYHSALQNSDNNYNGLYDHRNAVENTSTLYRDMPNWELFSLQDLGYPLDAFFLVLADSNHASIPCIRTRDHHHRVTT